MQRNFLTLESISIFMKNYKKLFLIFAFYLLCSEIAERLLFVFFPMYLVEKGFSALEIGGVFSLAFLIFVLSRVLIGKLSDIFGRKYIASLGLIFSSLGTYFYTLSSSFSHFSISKSLKEFGNTLTQSVYDAMQADSFPRKIRKHYLRKLGTVFPVGRALGAFLGFTLSLYFSFITGFFVSSLLFFLAALAFLLFYPEKGRKKALREKIFSFNIKTYSAEFMIASYIAFVASFSFTIAYYPAFFLLVKKLKISTTGLFLILLALYIFSAIFIHLNKKRIEKVDERKLTMISLGFMGIGTIGYAISFSKFIFIISIFILGISYYVWRIGFKVFLYNSTVFGIRGEQLGFVKTIEGLASILGPLISGIFIETLSLRAPFLFASFLYFSGVILIKAKLIFSKNI